MHIATRSYDLSQVDFSDSLDSLLQRIYQSRGVNCEADLSLQLTGLPTPDSLIGIEAAVEHLIAVLQAQQRVLIVGDFDADGATSSALMILALTAMGYKHLDFLVPNRFQYGYGLTPEIVELARSKKPDLIITVDNGISSLQGVAYAKQLGISVVITDHHLPGLELPDAVAIINPNQPGCGFPCKNLAGVGVAFYVLSALRAELRRQNWFAEQNIAEPTMAGWLDLVALGTVADVVPLDRVNRTLVYQGLMRIRAGNARPGIKALLRIAGKNPARLVAADLGFAIGPRLNAAGRLDDMSVGIQCLLSEDANTALQIAQGLDDLNQERRSIEQEMQAEAATIVDAMSLDKQPLPVALTLYQADWHQGLIGLLASRIRETYYRPVAVFARDDSGVLKGSLRSIPGLHIRDTLDAIATRNPGLISKFGGHAMAAGLSLDEMALERFKQAFRDQVANSISEDDLHARLITDGNLQVHQINMHTARLLRDAGPWGQLFPEPCFEGLFVLKQQRIVGEKHLKLQLAPVSSEHLTLDAIYFNVDLEKWPTTERLVRCVYQLDINEFRGRENLQLIIQYMEPSGDTYQKDEGI
jgi:single-stranded-DNA-specific exonuclease